MSSWTPYINKSPKPLFPKMKLTLKNFFVLMGKVDFNKVISQKCTDNENNAVSNESISSIEVKKPEVTCLNAKSR